jgi:hypothetical protein
MKRFMESLRSFGQRIVSAVMDMSPRDRLLLGGMVSALLLGLFGSGLWWMDSRETDLELKIESRRTSLATIQGQLAGHRVAQAEVIGLQQRLIEHSGSSLASFIERTSKTVNVDDRLTGVSSRQSTRDGDIETSRYAMTLKGLTLEELGDFLYAVETSDYPVRIDTMKITRSKKEDVMVLSPSLELSAFSFVGEPDGSTP